VIAGKLFTPAEMAAALATEQVTVMSGSPAVWETLLDSSEFAGVEPSQLHVCRAIVGGAPLSRRLFEAIRARFPAAPLIQTYGMTELRGYMMTTVPEDTEDVRFATVGGLLPGFETELRAGDGARITAPDTPGELYVRGEILQDYTLDGQAVPARGDDGWFATGDLLSCRADGNWVFHTRLREIAKVRGESVSLSSVDLALAELPGVVRAVTVAFPVEHGDRLEAVVEVAQSSTAAEILAAARDHMAPFRVPARIWIKSPTRPWPTLPSGKISRSMVAEQLIPTEPTGEAP
jgi:acyl-CoA synthetase (AMP-forming)/AMP-acid ligase II